MKFKYRIYYRDLLLLPIARLLSLISTSVFICHILAIASVSGPFHWWAASIASSAAPVLGATVIGCFCTTSESGAWQCISPIQRLVPSYYMVTILVTGVDIGILLLIFDALFLISHCTTELFNRAHKIQLE